MAAYSSDRGNGLTAAHKTLAFGTRVRVTDLKTGRSVIVTINDRGPFNRGRVLDLCTRVARALGIIDRGIVYVRADILQQRAPSACDQTRQPEQGRMSILMRPARS